MQINVHFNNVFYRHLAVSRWAILVMTILGAGSLLRLFFLDGNRNTSNTLFSVFPLRWEEGKTDRSTTMKIYVYELPRHLGEDVLNWEYPEGSWLQGSMDDYEGDLWMYKVITKSSLRTYNPEEATLFYIPMLPTRVMHRALEAEDRGWFGSVDASAQYTAEVLTYVQESPYWRKMNGRDHFSTFTDDNGRCHHLKGLNMSLWGEMFVAQHLGDLVMRDHVAQNYPCYRSDRDVLIPSPLRTAFNPFVEPLGRKRNITALYRFSADAATSLHLYHNKVVRTALSRLYDENPLPGSDWGSRPLAETLEDMAQSIFCICPPGVVAHTSRFWRSIRRGCIPVTFFRAYELPFQHLGVDYSKFTVNIEPDSIGDLNDILTYYLRNRDELARLMRNLTHVQRKFDMDSHLGAYAMLKRELQIRSDRIIALREINSDQMSVKKIQKL